MQEITSLAKVSGMSKPTVMAHIEAMTVANAIYLVQPFFGGSKEGDRKASQGGWF